MLLAGIARALFYDKLPTEVLSPESPDSSTVPLFDWTNYPKLCGLFLLFIGAVSFVSWCIMNYMLSTVKNIASPQGDSTWLALFVLLPILLGAIYFFWTGTNFPPLMNLLVLAVGISVAALISSQTQVNT